MREAAPLGAAHTTASVEEATPEEEEEEEEGEDDDDDDEGWSMGNVHWVYLVFPCHFLAFLPVCVYCAAHTETRGICNQLVITSSSATFQPFGLYAASLVTWCSCISRQTRCNQLDAISS